MFHKISKVETLQNYELKVYFCEGITKIYDIKPLFDEIPMFCRIRNMDAFSKVKVDAGGYGISWNDNIDLSCDELWNKGLLERDK